MRSPTFKKCIIAAVIALLGVGGFIALFYMTKAEVDNTSIIQAQISEQVAFADQNHALSLLVNDITPAMTNLSNRIVASDGTVSFIGKVEDLAKQAGLTVVIKSISTTDAVPKQYFQWMQITVETEGSFADQYKFLSLLENWPYDVTIGDVTFAQNEIPDASSHGNKSVWDGTISFNVLQEK